MNIAIIGAGYVGIATAVLMLRDKSNKVDFIEKSKDRRKSLMEGNLPIKEDGMNAVYETAFKEGRVSTYQTFRDDKTYDFIFVCIGTPQEGRYLSTNALWDVMNQIQSRFSYPYPLIIIKSTLPVGFTQTLNDEYPGLNIIFSPEFLREGTAFNDSKNPDRVIIGSKDDTIYHKILNLYKGVLTKSAFKKCKFLKMDSTSAELVKLAANSYLAVRLSYFNELSLVCETCDAEIKDVIDGLILDPRIGKSYCDASIGYAGPCLPKDTTQLSSQFSMMHTLKGAIMTNDYLQEYYTQSIQGFIDGSESKRILFLGIAFKSYSDDLRTSRSIQLYHDLKVNGSITIYDPRANYNVDIEGREFDLVILSSSEYVDMLNKISYKKVFDIKSILKRDQINESIHYIGKQGQ